MHIIINLNDMLHLISIIRKISINISLKVELSVNFVCANRQINEHTANHMCKQANKCTYSVSANSFNL